MHYPSGIWFPDNPKWMKAKKMIVRSYFAEMMLCQIILITSYVFIKFRYWPNFHVRIIIGFEISTIFIHKGFYQKLGNLENLS